MKWLFSMQWYLKTGREPTACYDGAAVLKIMLSTWNAEGLMAVWLEPMGLHEAHLNLCDMCDMPALLLGEGTLNITLGTDFAHACKCLDMSTCLHWHTFVDHIADHGQRALSRKEPLRGRGVRSQRASSTKRGVRIAIAVLCIHNTTLSVHLLSLNRTECVCSGGVCQWCLSVLVHYHKISLCVEVVLAAAHTRRLCAHLLTAPGQPSSTCQARGSHQSVDAASSGTVTHAGTAAPVRMHTSQAATPQLAALDGTTKPGRPNAPGSLQGAQHPCTQRMPAGASAWRPSTCWLTIM